MRIGRFNETRDVNENTSNKQTFANSPLGKLAMADESPIPSDEELNKTLGIYAKGKQK